MRFGDAVALLAGVAIVGQLLFLGVVEVQGRSTLPGIEPGQRLIYLKRATPELGDVVVVEYPEGSDRFRVKRVAAVGPARVQLFGGQLWVDGELLGDEETLGSVTCGRERLELREERFGDRSWRVATGGDEPAIELREGEVWLLGDNRGNSRDSRAWGALDHRLIKGVVGWSLFSRNRCN